MKSKTISIGILLSITFVFSSHAQQDDFPVLKGPYLGQKPPGTKPQLFAYDIIDNGDKVFAITFSPDGKECFYTKSIKTSTIMTTREMNSQWSKPVIAEFSGKFFDFEPIITPDGKKMIFGSKRPMSSDTKAVGIPQWFVKKTDNEWSVPKPMGSPFIDRFCMYVSVVNNGSIYFTGMDGIYLSKYINGKYLPPEKLDDKINSLQYAAHPFVAPDESYIVFDAQPVDGNAELFISFKNNKNAWTEPVKLGSDFNTHQNELCAFVSRDGKYLFFSRLSSVEGDIYWVDAKIVEKLNPKDL